MKEKNLNLNLILNGIRVAMAMFFPMITFPYVSRVLSPTLIGEYNYANSWINYFILIAGLGISTYAIRSGSIFRENKKALEQFISEVFSLNILSTLVSYCLLAICFICFDTFSEYRISILLFSFSILFRTIGVEWIFGIFEDYKYITIRSIIFHIISILMLFTFVRDENDLYAYIIINVLTNVGSDICNFFYARKLCNFKIIISKNVLSHLKSVIIIFSTTLATIIYVNSDTTMLGILCGTEQVGYYTVACKMYNCIKSFLNGTVSVFMARLSYQYKSCKAEYEKTFKYAFELLTCITIPLAVGALFFSKDIILLLSGDEYFKAESAMQLLFISLIFATLGNLYCSGGLLQANKEKITFLATGIGAIFNVTVNFFLIPIFLCTGAAISTLMTEILIFIILLFFFKKYVGTNVGVLHILKCLVATIPFGIIKAILGVLNLSNVLFQMSGIGVCCIIYFLILIMIKDEFMFEIWMKCKRKIMKW